MRTGIASLLGVNKQVESFRLKRKEKKIRSKVQKRTNNKIFCIGRNKTGTTSLKKAFEREGFILGNQREAEKLGGSFREEEYDALIEYCSKAEVFQDFPFSYPPTYKVMHEVFPEGKFILTIRDSADQWYKSLTSFHTKLFGKNGNLPTVKNLKQAKYVEEGWMWENFNYLYGFSEKDNPYDKEKLINHYEQYNREVIEYFQKYPDQFIVLNLSEESAFKNFCDFIEIESEYKSFPWENKTSEIKK